MNPAAYRPKGFAEALDVSERLVWRWIKRGQIRSLKVGRCRLIPASELARIVGEQPAQAVPSRPVSREAVRLLKAARG